MLSAFDAPDPFLDAPLLDPSLRFERDLCLWGVASDFMALGVSIETRVLGPEEVWIQNLEASRPGAGNGSRALGLLCGLADEHGVTLRLCAKPFGQSPMTPETLARFYAKAGFESCAPHMDEPEVEAAVSMRRLPR